MSKSIIENCVVFFSYPKPIEDMDMEDSRQNRLQVIFTLVIALLTGAVFFLRFIANGFQLSITEYFTLGAVALYVLSLFLIKIYNKRTLAFNIALFTGSIVIFIRSLATGGIFSSVLLWYITIPIIVIVVHSRKLGVFWTFFTLLQLFIISKAHELNLPVNDSGDHRTIYLITISMVISMVSSLIYFFERERVRHLESLVKAEINLANSKKLAALGRISGGMAHQINNPLTIIAGSIEVLSSLLTKEQLDKEKCDKTIQNLKTSIYRIRGTVNAMRTFTNSDYSNIFLEVNLAKSIEDALLGKTYMIAEQKIKIINKTQGHNYLVKGQAELIQVLIENILTNAVCAVKNQDDAWIKIEISKNSKMDLMVLAITNSGAAISDSIVDKIMDPFFTTKPLGEGAGLGLSLCQNITSAHKGKLFVNEESSHTQFVLELPISQTK